MKDFIFDHLLWPTLALAVSVATSVFIYMMV